MKLRMSKAPAVCRWTRSVSGSGASRRCCWLMTSLLSEEQAEDDDHAEREAGDGVRAPETGQPDLLRVYEVLPRRLRVHEATQLGDRLGLGHQRHDHAEHDVD